MDERANDSAFAAEVRKAMKLNTLLYRGQMSDLIHRQMLNGEIVYCEDERLIYVNINGQLTPIVPSEPSFKAVPKYTNHISVCPSCGAPHKESDECCEYCGSYFKERTDGFYRN